MSDQVIVIKDWNKHYENNRSRAVTDLTWVPIKNKHDGLSYATVIAHEDGAKIFAAFILMVEVASRCQPRGRLVRSDGTRLTPKMLALRTRAPEDWFLTAIPVLKDVDWIELTNETSGERQAGDSQVAGDCQAGDEERKKEGNGKKGRKEVSDSPPSKPSGEDVEHPTLSEVLAFAESPVCGFPFGRAEEWFHDQEAQNWKFASNWKARMLADRNKEYWRKKVQPSNLEAAPAETSGKYRSSI